MYLKNQPEGDRTLDNTDLPVVKAFYEISRQLQSSQIGDHVDAERQSLS